MIILKEEQEFKIEIWNRHLLLKALLDHRKITNYETTKDKIKDLKDKKGNVIKDKEGKVKTETIKSTIPKLPKRLFMQHTKITHW